MWGAILSFLGGPIVNGIINAYKAKLAAQNTTDAQAAELARQEIMGEITARQTEATIIRQEQGWWVTALPRPMFAFAFVIYVWKLVVVDKVIGPGCIWLTKMCWDGSTDPLSPELSKWALIVLTAYFGGRTIEKVARVFRR
jgi:hypothetical protein